MLVTPTQTPTEALTMIHLPSPFDSHHWLRCTMAAHGFRVTITPDYRIQAHCPAVWRGIAFEEYQDLTDYTNTQLKAWLGY